MNERSKAFLNEASKNLDNAKGELFKPAEDLVSFSVCKNSQYAIENFLKGYVLKNNAEIEVKDTIASLYEKCVKIDPNFKNIEIKAISCKDRGIDSDYCTNLDKLSACLDTADNIDTYLRKKNLL